MHNHHWPPELVLSDTAIAIFPDNSWSHVVIEYVLTMEEPFLFGVHLREASYLMLAAAIVLHPTDPPQKH